jgi:hypothetical protein
VTLEYVRALQVEEGRMRFTAEVHREPDGRLEGVFLEARGAAIPFSGVIELIGLIESGLDVVEGKADEAVDRAADAAADVADRASRTPWPGLWAEH